MYNLDQIVTAFISQIGLRKSADPSATANPFGDLLIATSGRYYNDEHAYLTNRNLAAIAESYGSFTYPTYSALTTYAKSDIVVSSGRWYVSLVNANLANAVSSAAHWRETTPYSEFWRTRIIAGIRATIDDWFALKFSRRSVRNLLSRDQVIESPGLNALPIDTTKRYVAWRITPSPAQDIAVTIHRVAIQQIASVNTTVSLYRNGASTPIETVAATGDGKSNWIWVDTGWELEPGSFYYMAIDRNSIATTPINALAGMDKGNWSYSRFPGLLPYLEVSAFDHDGPSEPGWSAVDDRLTSGNNYGFNAVISARCDMTKLVIDQLPLFIPVVQKRVAMVMLRELAFNPNAVINREEGNIDSTALLYEIDGNPQGRKTGIKADYEAMLSTITFDTNGISSECLPCRKNQIRIGAA